MGNSSSKSPSAAYISNPGPLKGVEDKSADGVHRRATAHASSHTTLHAPSASGSHRRTRSAIAHGERPASQAPPPSYQEAVRAPVNSPTTDTNVNSFSNNLLSVPAPLVHHRSRSQDATRNSRNPFRQRPVSYNGAAAQSNVGRDLPPTPAANAPAAPSAGASAAPRWTTEEERLAYLRRPLRQESYENALEILRRYNTVIVVDDSASMTKENRWTEARNALAALADTAANYDADGIDVCFLNSRKEGNNLKACMPRNEKNQTRFNSIVFLQSITRHKQKAVQVQRLFDSVHPNGLTPIGDKLDRLLRQYMNELDLAKRSGREESIKPVNYIVITDGAATDDPAEVIVNAARRLDKGGYLLSQLGIQFVQIGTDRNATRFLQQLDDDIASEQGVRDIVDTTPYLGGQLNAETIIKILLGGINRRVDRRGGLSVMSG